MRLRELVREICRTNNMEILKGHVRPERVHLLLSVPPHLVPIRVPRVRSIEGGEIPLRSYEALSHGGETNDRLLRRVLYRISCRNYEAAAAAIPGAIGLSSSSVSRGFVQASAAKLREMRAGSVQRGRGGAVPG